MDCSSTISARVAQRSNHDGEPAGEYLARCASDPLARRIKPADIADKRDPSNFVGLSNARATALQVRARRRLQLLDALVNRFDSQPEPHHRWSVHSRSVPFRQARVQKRSALTPQRRHQLA